MKAFLLLIVAICSGCGNQATKPDEAFDAYPKVRLIFPESATIRWSQGVYGNIGGYFVEVQLPKSSIQQFYSNLEKSGTILGSGNVFSDVGVAPESWRKLAASETLSGVLKISPTQRALLVVHSSNNQEAIILLYLMGSQGEPTSPPPETPPPR